MSSRTGKQAVLSPREAGILLSCSSFDTIDTHALSYAAKFGLPEGFVRESLSLFVDQGFLVSKSEFVEAIRQNVASAGIVPEDAASEAIGVIAIPTTDRPDELSRCIASILRNLSAHGRTPLIVIADGSVGESLETNKQEVARFKGMYAGEILHLDLDTREKMAERLAKASGVDSSLVRYAICGEGDTSIRTGALRNAALLSAAGKKMIFVDDDVIWDLHVAPGSEGLAPVERLALTSAPPRQTWIFDSYDEATATFPKVELDYLAAHEALLGKRAAGAIASAVAESSFIDEPGACSDSFVRKLEALPRDDGMVVTTYSGAVGHSWMRVHAPTMTYGPKGDHHIWSSDEETYKKRRKSPFIGRVSEGYALYDGPNCVSFNMGIDAREEVPPFTPTYRSQDAVFGYALYWARPCDWNGFVPVLVEHRRHEERAPRTDPVESFTTVGKMVIHALSAVRKSLIEQGRPATLAHMGMELSRMAREDRKTLIQATEKECARRLYGFAEYCRSIASQHPEGPAYWQAGVEAAKLKAQGLGDDIGKAPIFWDVPEWAKQQRSAWNSFADVFGRYGELLAAWPAIFSSAQSTNRHSFPGR